MGRWGGALHRAEERRSEHMGREDQGRQNPNQKPPITHIFRRKQFFVTNDNLFAFKSFPNSLPTVSVVFGPCHPTLQLARKLADEPTGNHY